MRADECKEVLTAELGDVGVAAVLIAHLVVEGVDAERSNQDRMGQTVGQRGYYWNPYLLEANCT